MVKLKVKSGSLYVGDTLLLYVYPAGDCDRAPWPLKSDKDRGILASALFDACETGDLPGNERSVELPNGKVFDIDAELYKFESSKEKCKWEP